MTKKELAKQLLQLVKDGIEEEYSDVEITDDIEVFIGCLEPRDRNAFANWGYPEQRSTPNECWI